MKQITNKVLIGLLFGFGLLLISTYMVDAQMAQVLTQDDGGGGGGGGGPVVLPTTGQISLTADLDKTLYGPGDLIQFSSSAFMSACSNAATNISIDVGIVGSVVPPETILYQNINGIIPILGSASLTAPSVPGDYILRVKVQASNPKYITTTGPGICDGNNGDYFETQNQYDGLGNITVPGGHWVCITNPPADVVTSSILSNGNTTEVASKDIPFTVSGVSTGPTITVWPTVSPLNLLNTGTNINWIATGLDEKTAYCTSPQYIDQKTKLLSPDTKFLYPKGSFDTGELKITKDYTVICKDDASSTTVIKTNKILKQFASSEGEVFASVSPLALGNSDQTSTDPSYWHLPFPQDPIDFRNVRQTATIIFGNNKPIIETLTGFALKPLSLLSGDLPAQIWKVQEDGTYKIDFSSNGSMKVQVRNRGGFIAAANFYLKINNDKFPLAPNNSGDECSYKFAYPVQYSITSIKNCDTKYIDTHNGMSKEIPYSINFTKIVSLKAGDSVEIKGSFTGWGFNSSILRDKWQDVSFFINTNSTKFNITEQ